MAGKPPNGGLGIAEDRIGEEDWRKISPKGPAGDESAAKCSDATLYVSVTDWERDMMTDERHVEGNG